MDNERTFTYYLLLFVESDGRYKNLIEDYREGDGFVLCSDPSMAIPFCTVEDAHKWAEEHGLVAENDDYGIFGAYS